MTLALSRSGRLGLPSPRLKPPVHFKGRTISLMVDTRFPDAKSYEQRLAFQRALEGLAVPEDFTEFATSIRDLRVLLPQVSSQVLREPVHLVSDSPIRPNTLGEHALFLMSRYGHQEDIQTCDRLGIDLNAIDPRPGHQPTALMKAIAGSNRYTFTRLLQKASPQALQTRNQAGLNAMDLARKHQSKFFKQALKPYFTQNEGKASLLSQLFGHMTGR